MKFPRLYLPSGLVFILFSLKERAKGQAVNGEFLFFSLLKLQALNCARASASN
jgi:hypothetical protein